MGCYVIVVIVIIIISTAIRSLAPVLGWLFVMTSLLNLWQPLEVSIIVPIFQVRKPRLRETQSPVCIVSFPLSQQNT